eukprot:514874-Rhodomonas_salina.1
MVKGSVGWREGAEGGREGERERGREAKGGKAKHRNGHRKKRETGRESAKGNEREREREKRKEKVNTSSQVNTSSPQSAPHRIIAAESPVGHLLTLRTGHGGEAWVAQGRRGERREERGTLGWYRRDQDASRGSGCEEGPAGSRVQDLGVRIYGPDGSDPRSSRAGGSGSRVQKSRGSRSKVEEGLASGVQDQGSRAQ